MPSNKGYQQLPRHSDELEDRDLEKITPPERNTTWIKALLAVLVLLASNTLTAFIVKTCTLNTGAVSTGVRATYEADSPSPFAGLTYDTDSKFGGHDEYTDRNDTFRDALWQSINIDAGLVALPDDVVEQQGLPVAQRFPWDESKGIYLLHGYHNLHCTRNIYISLMEYRYGLPQSRNFRHVMHCLDALRRDVICNADDTPRWTENNEIPETGYDQPRKCRNWSKLEEWAKSNSACYRYLNETAAPEDFPQIQRFVWCPEGSPYREKVAKYFDVDWEHDGKADHIG